MLGNVILIKKYLTQTEENLTLIFGQNEKFTTMKIIIDCHNNQIKTTKGKR